MVETSIIIKSLLGLSPRNKGLRGEEPQVLKIETPVLFSKCSGNFETECFLESWLLVHFY